MLKSPHAESLLNVLLDAMSCMIGRKMIGKENKKITVQIHDVTWQIQEVKSTVDDLEKQAASCQARIHT